MELLDLTIAMNPVEAADLLIDCLAGRACLLDEYYTGDGNDLQTAVVSFSQESRPVNALLVVTIDNLAGENRLHAFQTGGGETGGLLALVTETFAAHIVISPQEDDGYFENPYL